MSDVSPRFQPVDLTELQDAGVLMAANEMFFWPFGLALTWERDEQGKVSNLHVREGAIDPQEPIELDDADEIGLRRRDAFEEWSMARVASMKPDETDAAMRVIERWHHDVARATPASVPPAALLDVERLAEAMARSSLQRFMRTNHDGWMQAATEVKSEYARLVPQEPTPEAER